LERAGTAHLRAWDLTPAQFDVLAQLQVAEGATQRELAERLVVTEGNITQLVDRMQRRGLIERHAEGRCNRLALTEAGARLAARVVPEHEAVIASLFSVLSASEQQDLRRLLRKLERGGVKVPDASCDGEARS
jgi:DNA-binding MarR family transcriptional regulator